ncbi:MAG: GYD domain-containing protein [Bacillati bacterium ANGP1]|uniref:GYD domain-containing protein n=1 Tax=Candidatus Segetimicrobium genomatis TaxID=2569760 RepID=A0A537J739_9BACT|nr:MAG: GYD domain-containing protein [Terrabacteria group bacterium ANGP1]
MATYVALLNWTEQGVQTVKDTVKRADAFQAAAKKAGCTVREIVWTTGPYDAVGIFEAPDNQVASRLALSLGVQGAVRSLTMPAFTKEDRGKIIAGLPK